MTNETHRGRGRPPVDEPKIQLRVTITPATLKRFELAVAKSKRSYWLDNAINLMLDIDEGKRNLPILNNIDGVPPQKPDGNET